MADWLHLSTNPPHQSSHDATERAGGTHHSRIATHTHECMVSEAARRARAVGHRLSLADPGQTHKPRSCCCAAQPHLTDKLLAFSRALDSHSATFDFLTHDSRLYSNSTSLPTVGAPHFTRSPMYAGCCTCSRDLASIFSQASIHLTLDAELKSGLATGDCKL